MNSNAQTAGDPPPGWHPPSNPTDVYHDDFPESPLRVGNAVLIRTVTVYWLGEIVRIGAHEIVLRSASWIPDTGRFSVMLATGALSEVEPAPGYVSVMRAPVIDVCSWGFALPTEAR